MKKLSLMSFAKASLVASAVFASFSADAAKLILAGDSTLDEHGGDESVYGSWGAKLRPYLLDGNSIVNYALSGCSTKTFVSSGRWARVLDEAGTGDYVLIQFGHNDQKTNEPRGVPVEDFKINLSNMVAQVRAKGATPILATPIVRLYFKNGNVDDHGLDDWAYGMSEVAVAEGVDLVDMRALTRAAADAAGESEAATWAVSSSDRTHPGPKGAQVYARLFIAEIRSRKRFTDLFEHIVIGENDYEVNVPADEIQAVNASLVVAIGAKNLVKTGRGVLVGSADMANYTGTITVWEGALEIRTTSDLGTGDGGTVVKAGGTIVFNMSSTSQRFGDEHFTVAGYGDAAYDAAVYQSDYNNNDQFKIFKHLALSGNTTIFSGTRLGVDGGTLAMNGHSLAVTGANFYLRDVTYQAPLGNLEIEASVRFVRSQTATADASKTMTVRNGGSLNISESDIAPSFWTLAVGDGGKIVSTSNNTFRWDGDVVWNATKEASVEGLVVFGGEVTGTGTIHSSSGTLTFTRPLGAGVGLGLFGTATALLPPAKAFTYQHAGLMLGRYEKSDAWWEFNNNRVTDWRLCLEGPGPQIDQRYWTKGYWDGATGSEGEESVGSDWSLGSQGYIWNRESTNVTFHVWCRVLYKTYVTIGGLQCFVARNNAVDADTEVTIPANSCVPFLAMTAGSGNRTPGLFNADSGLRILGGDVLRDDGNGYLFTTNPVSGLVNPTTFPTLALAGGVIDGNNMPLSVTALDGMGTVTNTANGLTVLGSWTIDAEDLDEDRCLSVAGDLVFEDGAGFVMQNMRARTVRKTAYAICTADSISGFPDKATILDSDGNPWRCFLSEDGKTGYAMREHFMIIVW